MADHNLLFKDPNLKNIYTKMIDYLSRGDMAEQRLIDRICRLKLRYPKTKRYEGYTSENAWKVIPLLREQGFIDEDRYAQNLFNSLRDKKDGLRAIKRKMFNRQVRKSVVEHIIKDFELAEQHQDLAKIIAAARVKHAILQKKFNSDPVKKKQIRQKMYVWLAMRGFDAGELRDILSALDF